MSPISPTPVKPFHKFTTAGKEQNFSALGSSVLVPPSSPSLYQVAVDNSGGASAGDIYVPDSANHRVDKFDPSGEPDETTPFIGEGTLSGPVAAAVDSAGDVFVADASAGVVDEFSSEGVLLNTFGAGHIEGPQAIAIGPAPNEDVYVGTFNSGLVEFEHSGACVASCVAVDPDQILGLAVDSHGNVFADSTHDEINEYNSAGALLEQFGSPGEFFGEPHGIAVDASSEDVYVADPPQSVVKVFKPVPAFRLTVTKGGTGAGQVSSNPEGINYCESTCEKVYPEGTKVTLIARPEGLPGRSVFAGWSGECASVSGDECEVEMTAAKSVEATFNKVVFPEEVETKAATEITPTSATLNGAVNPGGVPLTECFFEYGETEAYGHKAECEPAAGSITGTSPVAVKASISVKGQEHFRLYTANANGSNSGADMVIPIPTAEADAVHYVSPAGEITFAGVVECPATSRCQRGSGNRHLRPPHRGHTSRLATKVKKRNPFPSMPK